ncbi:MAG: PIN domain-containing protein [Cyanobacteriota bacterium]|nr:PIN domain-containing protein [Cyanobacteriota bacterium]
MKILIDTNIVIDVALEREPFFEDSDRVLALAEEKVFDGYLSAASISDIFYIVRKDKGKYLTFEFLQYIISFCSIATVDERVIKNALASNPKDFEDAIQHQTALTAGLNGIVTQNPKDYAQASISVLTPTELLAAIGEMLR